ncbi:MAG: hypothetical protein ACI4QD_05795 [Kiritimatiellia bacterium]
MKKFLTICLALLLAVSAQAAALTWTAGKVYEPQADGSNGSTVMANYIAYIFEGNSSAYEAMVASINDGTFTPDAAFGTALSSTKNGIKATVGDFTPGSEIDIYMVVFNASSYADATFFRAAYKSISMPDTGDGTANFQTEIGTGNWSPISTVPEPVFMGIFASAMVAVLLRRQKNLA